MSKYLIEDTTLTSIADAVRDKAGTTELIKVSELPTAIANIPSGGGGGGDSGIPEEAFTITGNCSYRFANNGWNWFLESYGNQMTTNNITNAGYMFINADRLTNIPFDINLEKGTTLPSGTVSYIFQNCYALKAVPLINGDLRVPSSAYSGNLDFAHMFQGCYRLREIPENYFWNIADEAYWNKAQEFTSGGRSNLFQHCYSLRKLPDISMLKNKADYYSCLYYNLCYACFVLDEIVDLPVLETKFTSNAFSNTFSNCGRINKITFETNEDGSPKTANWKNQTIDLTIQVGYAPSSYITGYNSGITADKEASSEATYQAVKNDPDWYASTSLCSRYDHNSAVATINSLPDCSATGINTIKFKGTAGSATDGGAINTLTEEEIAVATAKGWTVSLV